jgi:hypothetical protein
MTAAVGNAGAMCFATLEQLEAATQQGAERALAAKRPPFITRKRAVAQGIELRVFDRAARELARTGKAFRPGRQIMLDAEAFEAWVRSQPARAAALRAQKEADPYSFAAFADGVRKRRTA